MQEISRLNMGRRRKEIPKGEEKVKYLHEERNCHRWRKRSEEKRQMR